MNTVLNLACEACQRRVRIGSWAVAVVIGVCVAQVAWAQDRLSVEITGPLPGDGSPIAVDRNTVVVSGIVRGTHPVESIVVGGSKVQPAGGKPSGDGEYAVPFSHRVSLERGVNKVTVVARDAAGNTASASVSLNADFLALETHESKMTLCVLSAFKRTGGDWEVDDLFKVELEQALLEQGRFALVESAEIKQQSTEQAQSLSNWAYSLELRVNVAADRFLVAHRDTKDGEELVSLEIYTPAGAKPEHVLKTQVHDVDDVEPHNAAAERLAALLSELYPRVTGKILAVNDEAIVVDLGESFGMRPGMELLVLRENDDGLVDAETGEVIMEPTVSIAARAVITEVTGNGSRCEVTDGGLQVSKGMAVITR